MAAFQPFSPHYTSGQIVSATATAASATINATSKNVCVTNSGANIAYVRISDSSVTATTSDFPILSGQQAIITKATDEDVLSYISPLGATLHIMTGEGWK